MAKVCCGKCRASSEEELIKRCKGSCPSCGSVISSVEEPPVGKFFDTDPFASVPVRLDGPETILELSILDEHVELPDCSECASERAAGHNSCIYCDKQFSQLV